MNKQRLYSLTVQAILIVCVSVGVSSFVEAVLNRDVLQAVVAVAVIGVGTLNLFVWTKTLNQRSYRRDDSELPSDDSPTVDDLI